MLFISLAKFKNLRFIFSLNESGFAFQLLTSMRQFLYKLGTRFCDPVFQVLLLKLAMFKKEWKSDFSP